MSWTDDLAKLRRYVRDPDANIWTDAFLRHLYNDVQQDFQHRTGLLEDVAVQRVPGFFNGSFQFEWETGYIGETLVYHCLTRHDGFTVCSAWEAQELTGPDSDATDHGSHFTHPWEAYMTEPGDPVKIHWPTNLNMLLFIAYDNDAIGGSSKKAVQSRDSSYITTEGDPVCFYDWGQDEYVLYPRPSTSFYNESATEGGDVTTGDTAVPAATYGGSDGATVSTLDGTDNLFMIYKASPTDMSTGSDESDLPFFLRKYILFGAAGRAYAANTDGRIRSLGELWEARYELGVAFTKKYLRNKRQDRDYRLSSSPVRRAPGRPRLPDTYPAV